MKQELINFAVTVLRWWKEHNGDYCTTDDGEFNIYNEAPDFVNNAFHIIRKYAPEKEYEIFGNKE